MKAVLLYNPRLFGTKLAQWILLGEFQHPWFQMDTYGIVFRCAGFSTGKDSLKYFAVSAISQYLMTVSFETSDGSP